MRVRAVVFQLLSCLAPAGGHAADLGPFTVSPVALPVPPLMYATAAKQPDDGARKGHGTDRRGGNAATTAKNKERHPAPRRAVAWLHP